MQPGWKAPRGRPKGTTITAELRRQMDAEGIARRLLDIIDDPTTSKRDVRDTAALVLDRTEGKSVSRNLSLRLGAAEILPPHFASLPPEQKRRALEDIRRRAVAGMLPEPEQAEEHEDDADPDE